MLLNYMHYVFSVQCVSEIWQNYNIEKSLLIFDVISA